MKAMLDQACTFHSILSIQITEFPRVMHATQVWPCNWYVDIWSGRELVMETINTITLKAYNV